MESAWRNQDCYGKEIAGHGIHAVLELENGRKDLYIGNERLMKAQGITITEVPEIMGTSLYIAEDGVFLGSIIISDTVREDVRMHCTDSEEPV